MVKKFFTLVTLLMTAIFLVGCGGVSSNKTLSSGSSGIIDDLSAGRIQGRVTQYGSTIPIKDAIIEINEVQAVTTETGEYSLGPIYPGDHRVVARARGYEVTMQDPVRVFTGKITENINFQLMPQGATYADNFAIIAMQPTMGSDGDQITIYCQGCGNNPGEVTFNGKKGQIIDWNSTQDGRILVNAPEAVESGPVRVLIDGKNSNEPQLFNFIARPAILSADPAIANASQIITLYGRNFNLIPNFNTVKLSGDSCYVNSVANHTTMRVTLPANAKTGPLTIEINSDSYTLEGTSDAQITIIPSLTHISPKRTLASTNLTKPVINLYGTNFGTDRNLVRVTIGANEIMPASFLSFSDNRISFYAPTASNLSPGTTTDVRVKINQSYSNALQYTSYNPINTTLNPENYGIHDFDDVSSNGTLRLSMLRPNDRLVFISVLSASNLQDVSEDEVYTISSYLGGNYQPIPTLPASARQALPADHPYNLTGDPALSPNASPFYTPSNFREKAVPASPVMQGSVRPSYRSNVSSSIRAAISEPAESEINVFVRDFTSDNPWEAENDILATATLIATGTKALVYYDTNLSGLTKENASIIASNFDILYTKIKAELGILTPPEGNVDEQERILILMSPLLEKGTTVISSYFDPRDKTAAALNSAGTEIIYASPNVFKTNTKEFYASLAQSLNQMFYYNQKHVSGVYYGVPWQEAGLSTIARQAAGYGYAQGNSLDVERVSSFLGSPYKYSLDSWPNPPKQGDYGLQFLMTTYLMDKCNGKEALTHLGGTNGGAKLHTGLADLEILLGKNGYNDFNEFFQNFCLALYCDNLNLDPSTLGYDANEHELTNINLRQGGVAGLRGGSFSEAPVDSTLVDIKGNSCRLFMYPLGNWGDVETTIQRPSSGVFKTWVLYYSAEQLQ